MHKNVFVNGKSKKAKVLPFFLKIFFSTIILYLVLSSVSLNEYRHLIDMISIKPIIGIMWIVILQILLLASRWYLLARSAGSLLSIKGSIYGTLMCFFFSQGLPASIGGDAFRLWWHNREGITTGNALKIILFDRIYGLFSLVIMCFVSLIYLVQLLNDQVKIFTLIFLVLFFGVAFVILFMPWRLGFSSRINSIQKFLPGKVSAILNWFSDVRNTLSKQNIFLTSGLLILGLLTHFLVVMQVYIVGHYINPEKINMLICICSVPLAMFVSYMPFSIAGWGVREASMVVTLSFFGVPASVAILISLSIGLSILLVSLVGGLVWILGGFRLAYKNNVDILEG